MLVYQRVYDLVFWIIYIIYIYKVLARGPRLAPPACQPEWVWSTPTGAIAAATLLLGYLVLCAHCAGVHHLCCAERLGPTSTWS